MLLGGRAAEQVFFDQLSTGAADDLVKATDIARSMVLRYGMSEQLGHVAYEREPRPMLGPPIPQDWQQPAAYSDETERYIDHSVRELTGKALARAIAILEKHRPLIEEAAQILQKKETLDAGDLAALRARLAAVPAPVAAA